MNDFEHKIFPLTMKKFKQEEITELTCLNWYDGPLDGLILVNNEICYYSCMDVDDNEYCQLKNIQEINYGIRFIFGVFSLKNNDELLVPVIKHLCLINNHYKGHYLSSIDKDKTNLFFEDKPELMPCLFTPDNLLGWFEW